MRRTALLIRFSAAAFLYLQDHDLFFFYPVCNSSRIAGLRIKCAGTVISVDSAEWKNEQTSLKNAADRCMDSMRTKESEKRSLEEKEEALKRKEGSPAEKDTYESMLAETRTLMEDCARRQKEFQEEYEAKKEELERLEQKNAEGEQELHRLLEIRTERLNRPHAVHAAICSIF